VLSNKAIAWAAALLIIIGIGLAVGLLVAFGNGQHPEQLDAIKTAGTIVVGTGGAAALWLTARRQQTTEIAINQSHAAHALQKQMAAATMADAEARRTTELYTKAADQLGSDKAPVRLAGMYALRRLAQENTDQRQTIVDVICAYLRMPYTAPDGDLPINTIPDVVGGDTREAYERQLQEREVRLTAQHILVTHLRPGGDPKQPIETFWPNIDLDLRGAVLIAFDFADIRVRNVQFMGAKFVDDARFTRGTIAGHAGFWKAEFTGYSGFESVVFGGDARFMGVKFAWHARFEGARFGEARFAGVEFAKSAWFGDTEFVLKPDFAEGLVQVDTENASESFWPEGWVLTDGISASDSAKSGAWKRLVCNVS
jgi:uncharacterized protein YjbI with pentapeptide repeats